MQVVQPVIVPIESLLVDLGYVQQARDALHDFAQAPVALFVFRRQFSPPGGSPPPSTPRFG
jgi:hypothetical protein